MSLTLKFNVSCVKIFHCFCCFGFILMSSFDKETTKCCDNYEGNGLVDKPAPREKIGAILSTIQYLSIPGVCTASDPYLPLFF